MILFGILGIGMLAGWTAGWITRMNDTVLVLTWRFAWKV